MDESQIIQENGKASHQPNHLQNGHKDNMDQQEETAGSCSSDVFRYGWFRFMPSWLQRFNTAFWVLVFFSLGNSFQSGVVNGLLGLVLSTLETRFELASSQSSWIASAYELGTLPVLLAFCYIGSRIHRPRVVSAGFLLCSFGCLLFVLPHFLTPVYQPGHDDTDDNSLCQARTNTTSPCNTDDSSSSSGSLSSYLWFFIAARFLHGMGVTPVYNWGATYIDDCVSRETFSLYIGVFYAMGIIGPAVAIIGGGYLLNVHTDFLSEEESGLTPSDPLWVGAWWIGYVGLGVLCFIIILPMSGYPREIPGSAEIQREKRSEAYTSNSDIPDDIANGDMNITLSQLPHHLKILFTNPAFVLLTLFTSCDSLIIAAFASFGPKYVESQFALSAGMAGGVFGIVLLPAGVLGTILGGWFVKRFQFTCTDILKWETVQTMAIIVFSFILFLYCEPIQFAGVTFPYNDASTNLDIIDVCNTNCSCDDVLFEPVCGSNELQYFSACHAGCESSLENDGGDVEFFNCSCISAYSNDTDRDAAQATEGQCNSSSCGFVVLFFILFFIEVFLLFSCSTMNISATIRCVPGPQRSLAIGIQWISLRLLGSIPGPLLFGLAFDAACSLWSYTCDRVGSCLHYDSLKLSAYTFSICGCVKGASLIFILVAWLFYKSIKIDPDKLDIVEVVDGDDNDKNKDNHMNKNDVEIPSDHSSIITKL